MDFTFLDFMNGIVLVCQKGAYFFFYRSLEKCIRSLMGNVDDLNRTVMAYTKYIADKQRHDLTVYNAMQKRVGSL